MMQLRNGRQNSTSIGAQVQMTFVPVSVCNQSFYFKLDRKQYM
jgi:hypothetical protein